MLVWACRSAFSFEWFATYYILANKQGFIEKENLRAVYGMSLRCHSGARILTLSISGRPWGVKHSLCRFTHVMLVQLMLFACMPC